MPWAAGGGNTQRGNIQRSTFVRVGVGLWCLGGRKAREGNGGRGGTLWPNYFRLTITDYYQLFLTIPILSNRGNYQISPENLREACYHRDGTFRPKHSWLTISDYSWLLPTITDYFYTQLRKIPNITVGIPFAVFNQSTIRCLPIPIHAVYRYICTGLFIGLKVFKKTKISKSFFFGVRRKSSGGLG